MQLIWGVWNSKNAGDTGAEVSSSPDGPHIGREVTEIATGSPSFSNLSNVLVQDSSVASVSLTGAQNADWIAMKNFGFAIPASATVTSISLEFYGLVGGSGSNWQATVGKSPPLPRRVLPPP